MVEHQPSKLNTWVRFPSPALRYRFDIKCASGSVGGARPCQGRGRGFESRLALTDEMKGHPFGCPFFISSRHCRASNKFEVSPHIKWGSVSRKTEVHRTSCDVSRSIREIRKCLYNRRFRIFYVCFILINIDYHLFFTEYQRKENWKSYHCNTLYIYTKTIE